jgi:hypothetical protein
MSPDDFRRIALSMPEAKEVYRWGQWEFQVERRTFASFGGPAATVAALNLTSEQQEEFMHAAPRVFVSTPGGWGRLGSTNVVLASAEDIIVERAIEAAWHNVAPKSPLKRKKRTDTPPRS